MRRRKSEPDPPAGRLVRAVGVGQDGADRVATGVQLSQPGFAGARIVQAADTPFFAEAQPLPVTGPWTLAPAEANGVINDDDP